MVGLIEAAIWNRCKAVPTRAMILRASMCQSYEEAFALEDQLVCEFRPAKAGGRP